MAKQTNVNYRNQLIYSVFVRQYGNDGTFVEVEDDLDRIKTLGTDIIWLMPIHPIGEKSRKGSLGSPYAIKDYMAINEELGSMDDFVSLCDAIHKRGMKVIMDVVFNHTSPDSVLAEEHPEWFYHDEDGNFGNKIGDWWDIIDLDLENEELQEYLISVLVHWADYVDGFRCDVASLIPLDFWKRAREAVDQNGKETFWLAESVNFGFIKYLRGRGCTCNSDGELYQVFDALYDYDVYDDLTNFFTGKGELGRYLESLNRQEFIYPENYVKAHFLENHDQNRISTYILDDEIRKQWTAFSLFAKGIGFVYNGQEYSCQIRPDLFEKEVIKCTREDISELIIEMMNIKRLQICAKGSFEAKEIRKGIVKAVYTYKDEKLFGFFRLEGQPKSVDSGLADGDYINEFDGSIIRIYHGTMAVAKNPVIIKL